MIYMMLTVFFLDSETSRGIVGGDIAILTSKVDYIHPLEKGTLQGGLSLAMPI